MEQKIKTLLDLLTQADALAAELNADTHQNKSSFTAPIRARVHAALELVPNQLTWLARNPQPAAPIVTK